SIWEGGLVSYWAIVGGLLVAWWLFLSRPKSERAAWFNSLLIAAALGWGIGRIGNYYAGDSIGTVNPVWSAFYGRVPIQLWEAALCFGLVLLFQGRRLASIRTGLLLLILYFAGRFVIDFWRDEKIWLGLHLSQWVSLMVALLLASLLVTLKKRKPV
ncbi:prolipoprotein diacylglyceryl transferase, partial [Patescibacteria group bacterium]|nr:prolipoprotein diacylglyceryl transferase [Patescibacteria group bacterium]